MYALPGQTLAQLNDDLDMALSLSPPHLSIYHLTIEPNTQFAKFPPKHLPDEDASYDMLDDIMAFAHTQGLQRYEVSAFAKAAQRCWHNTNYWQFGDYLGIGAGAHTTAPSASFHSNLRSPFQSPLFFTMAQSHKARCALHSLPRG